jgi:hypothetical protein
MEASPGATHLQCCPEQAHGEKTAYALMIDADFEVEGAWRLRHAAHRMAQECRERSVVECPKGIKVPALCASPFPFLPCPLSVVPSPVVPLKQLLAIPDPLQSDVSSG